ncbi:unnamed protein product, partial [Symbiodinium sp. CCMP2456]
MVNSKVLSILPRVEARQTALRNALQECLDQISEHGHLLQKFQDLVKKGVTEEQVDACIREGSDPYGLERQKSLFKCMYQLGRRLQLVSLMLGKRDVLGTNMMPLDIAPKAEDVTTALRKMEGLDLVIVPLEELLDLANFIQSGLNMEDPETYKENIDIRAADARKIISATNAGLRSLKKGASDMKAAVQAHKASEQRRHDKSGGGSGGERAKKGGKLSKYAATSDPAEPRQEFEVIKIHKAIEKQGSIPNVRGFEDLSSRDSKGTRPFTMRKGKNILKLLLKDDGTRAEFQDLIFKFKEDFLASSKDKVMVHVSEGICDVLRVEVLQMIPGDTAWPFLRRSSKPRHTEQEIKDTSVFLDSVFVSGQKLQYVHRGADLGCVGSLRVQLEGVRLIILARVTELLAVLGDEGGIADAVNYLLRLEEAPSKTAIPSLVSAICKAGDVTFVPPGYLLVDKACMETNVRIPVPVFPPTLREGFCAYARQYPKTHLTAFLKVCESMKDGSISDGEEATDKEPEDPAGDAKDESQGVSVKKEYPSDANKEQPNKPTAGTAEPIKNPFSSFKEEMEEVGEWMQDLGESDGVILIDCIKQHPEYQNYLAHLREVGDVDDDYDIGQPDGDWTAEVEDFQNHLHVYKKIQWSVVDALNHGRAAQKKAMQDHKAVQQVDESQSPGEQTPPAAPEQKFDLMALSDEELKGIISEMKLHSRYPQYLEMLRKDCGEPDYDLGMEGADLILEIEAWQRWVESGDDDAARHGCAKGAEQEVIRVASAGPTPAPAEGAKGAEDEVLEADQEVLDVPSAKPTPAPAEGAEHEVLGTKNA